MHEAPHIRYKMMIFGKDVNWSPKQTFSVFLWRKDWNVGEAWQIGGRLRLGPRPLFLQEISGSASCPRWSRSSLHTAVVFVHALVQLKVCADHGTSSGSPTPIQPLLLHCLIAWHCSKAACEKPSLLQEALEKTIDWTYSLCEGVSLCTPPPSWLVTPLVAGFMWTWCCLYGLAVMAYLSRSRNIACIFALLFEIFTIIERQLS